MKAPRYILFAGINGSGKSTLYKSDLGLPADITYVNLDDEIRKAGDWRDIHINMQVGRQVVRQIRELLENKKSFIEETTLSGKSILKNVERASALGYQIDVFFVGLDSPELAIDRVHYRVAHGGHGVSDEDIRRRYYAGFENLKFIRPYCHSITFFDNTEHFRKIAIYTKDKGLVFNSIEPLPTWFTTYIHL